MIKQELIDIASQVRDFLRDRQLRLVLAESCTSGLGAVALSQIAGISEFFCGSAVTYRNATKSSWLNVSATALADPKIGPVSETVARQMVAGVLQATPEADIAAAITGHLGPNAPPELDGLAYIGVGNRDTIEVRAIRLMSGEDSVELRRHRQVEAAEKLLESVLLKV